MECDDGRVAPRSQRLDVVLQGQLNCQQRIAGSVRANPRTCRPCSTPGMAAAVAPLRSLNPYEPGPDGPGIGMLNWIDFGKENEGS